MIKILDKRTINNRVEYKIQFPNELMQWVQYCALNAEEKKLTRFFNKEKAKKNKLNDPLDELSNFPNSIKTLFNFEEIQTNNPPTIVTSLNLNEEDFTFIKVKKNSFHCQSLEALLKYLISVENAYKNANGIDLNSNNMKILKNNTPKKNIKKTIISEIVNLNSEDEDETGRIKVDKSNESTQLEEINVNKSQTVKLNDNIIKFDSSQL